LDFFERRGSFVFDTTSLVRGLHLSYLAADIANGTIDPGRLDPLDDPVLIPDLSAFIRLSAFTALELGMPLSCELRLSRLPSTSNQG
jgi:hypothetical protein